MRITAAIRRLNEDSQDGCCTVLFRSKDAEGLEGEVSLSRTAGDCLFTPNDFSNHDGHSPSWHSCENAPVGKLVDDLPEYVGRVFSDTVTLVGKPPKTVEVRAVGDDGALADEGEKFESTVQAIEKAVANEGNQAVLLSW